MKHNKKRRGRRVVVDTSVVISGISAFKGSYAPGKNSSADMLHDWVDTGEFVWLVTSGILEEYKEIARRLRVRPNVAGRLINLPILEIIAFVDVPKPAGPISWSR